MLCMWCYQPIEPGYNVPFVEREGSEVMEHHRVCVRVRCFVHGLPDPIPGDGPLNGCPDIGKVIKLTEPEPPPMHVDETGEPVAAPASAASGNGVTELGEPCTQPQVSHWPLGTPCFQCKQPVQRGITERYDVEGSPQAFHKQCAVRYVNGVRNAAKAAAREAMPTCPRCQKKIEPARKSMLLSDGSTWHQKCYQVACVEAGQPDPFAKEPKETGVECTLEPCNGKKIPRAEYPAHVAAHQAADGVRTT